MTTETLEASRVLEGVAKPLAEWTVEEQCTRDETFESRHLPAFRQLWVEDTIWRLNCLSQSLAVKEPRVFSEFVKWQTVGLELRNLPVSDLTTNLECARQVMDSQLPKTIVGLTEPALDIALKELRSPVSQPMSPVASLDEHKRLTLEYLEAILEERSDDAEQLILSSNLPVQTLYEKVLATAQGELGRLWQLDDISVAIEHFGTAVAQRVMAHLRSRLNRVAPDGRQSICVASGPDLHDVGLRMVADFMEADGWTNRYYGANLPLADLLCALDEVRPHLLVLSTSTYFCLRNAAETVHAVRNLECPPKILVGGLPYNRVPGLHQKIGADAAARSASEAVDVARQLVPAV